LVMLDMEGTDGREPISDFRVLLNELKLYMPGLVKKPELVAANKMDEPNAAENLKAFKKKFKGKIFPMSCVSDEGFDELKEALLEAVLGVRKAEKELEEEENEGNDN